MKIKLTPNNSPNYEFAISLIEYLYIKPEVIEFLNEPPFIKASMTLIPDGGQTKNLFELLAPKIYVVLFKQDGRWHISHSPLTYYSEERQLARLNFNKTLVSTPMRVCSLASCPAYIRSTLDINLILKSIFNDYIVED